MKNLLPMICAAFLCALGLSALTSALPAQNTPRLGRDPLRDVIAAMTLEEKAGLVVGVNAMRRPAGAPAAAPAPSLVPGAAGTTLAIPRLGIPSMVLADGPAGLRISPTRENDKASYYATAFPVSTLLASTWDTDLAAEVGRAVGQRAPGIRRRHPPGPGLEPAPQSALRPQLRVLFRGPATSAGR